MATKLRKRPCQTASFPELILGNVKDSRHLNTRNLQFQKRERRWRATMEEEEEKKKEEEEELQREVQIAWP